MKTEMNNTGFTKVKYTARLKSTHEWVEITEFEYNALFCGATWGIYYQAKCEVLPSCPA